MVWNLCLVSSCYLWNIIYHLWTTHISFSVLVANAFRTAVFHWLRIHLTHTNLRPLASLLLLFAPLPHISSLKLSVLDCSRSLWASTHSCNILQKQCNQTYCCSHNTISTPTENTKTADSATCFSWSSHTSILSSKPGWPLAYYTVLGYNTGTNIRWHLTAMSYFSQTQAAKKDKLYWYTYYTLEGWM